MNIGNGSLGLVKGAKASGAPFASASAHNGTSIDAEGKVVLGDDGDGSANLLNSRIIYTAGNLIDFNSDSVNKSINEFGTDFHQLDGATYPRRTFQIGENVESGWYHDTDQDRSILYIQNPPR